MQQNCIETLQSDRESLKQELSLLIINRPGRHYVSAVCRFGYFQLRQLHCIIQSLTSDVAKTLVSTRLWSAADSTTATRCCTASQTANYSDCSLCRTQRHSRWLALGDRNTITPILKSLYWLPVRQRVTFNARVQVYEGSCTDVPRWRLSPGYPPSNKIVKYSVAGCAANVNLIVGGVAEWVERWSRPTNFPYPTPDC